MMRTTLTAAMLCLLWPLTAQAQPAQPPPQPRDPRSAAQQEAMYENIEIMRRILQRGLSSAYAPHTADSGDGTATFGHFWDYGITDPRPLQGTYSADISTMGGTVSLYDVNAQRNLNVLYGDLAGLGHTSDFFWASAQPHWQGAPAVVEGVYLKGQGVVFTATLPAHQRVLLDPHTSQLLSAAYCTSCHGEAFKAVAEKAAPASDKLPSLWEQTRREIKGQPSEVSRKTKGDPKKLQICGPGTVGETVLRLLAENGSHLHVAGRESVTVVITFRPSGISNTRNFYYRKLSTLGESGKPAADQSAVTSVYPNSPPAEKVVDGKAASRELWKQGYENLGDLHAKQKHYTEAIEAYYKALEQNQEQKQQDVIRTKLLDALNAQLQLFEKMLGETKDTQGSRQKLTAAASAYLKAVDADLAKQVGRKPKGSSLPDKLIIGASKDLLDRSGQGSLSFDDFRKLATVEYLSFGGSK